MLPFLVLAWNASATLVSRGIVCHDLLICTKVTALAWTPENRLAPLENPSRQPLESSVNYSKRHWHRERRTRVIPLRVIFDASHTVLGPHAEWLPLELEDLLRKNGRFETAPGMEGPYSLWMIVPKNPRRGRTGVLLYDKKPIVVTDPDTKAEYLVEIKGAGLPIGGYQLHKSYTSPQGGMWDHHARLEYERLRTFEKIHRGQGVLGLGYQSFEADSGTQEILFRLTPGNLRVSYRHPSKLADEERHAMLTEMGRRVGELLGRGYGAGTHAENFVADLKQSRAFLTDYLDVAPLWNPEGLAGFNVHDVERLILATLLSPSNYHGFETEEDYRVILRGVRESLVKIGYLGEALTVAPTRQPIAFFLQPLMRAGLAARIVRDRSTFATDPFADKELVKILHRPCAEPDPNHRFWTLLDTRPQDFDAMAHSDNVSIRTYLKIDDYRAGRASLEDLLDDTFMNAFLETTRSLRLKPTKVDKYETPNLRSFANLRGRDASPFLDSSFPGLNELKERIEREHRLLFAASFSHPESPELARDRKYLSKLILFYKKTPLTAFRKLICGDRSQFRKLFYFPHHLGFDPTFLDALRNQIANY